MLKELKRDVLAGLSSSPKTLPSKYFYDKKGDKLFQQIMVMPEYYLSRAEMEIFTTKSVKIVESFEMDKNNTFELIELGAGDGTKTIKLLEKLLEQGYNFEYLPIDISQHALSGLKAMLRDKLPTLKVRTMQGTYFNVLNKLKERTTPKVILFLGSNLGNLLDKEASDFLYELGEIMHSGDKVLLGLDKLKSKEIVLPAYNDAAGITKEFNLNLLDRINRELGANFDRNQFDHAPEYETKDGIAKSFIVSLKDQKVTLDALDCTFEFKQGEKIHTEISRKYTEEILSQIIESTDLEISGKYTDRDEYFMNMLLTKN